ncbi:ankyrin repeat domain-containing protein [Wolbachia pipientis]|uniref:ankyrin repeat domain-containing protein n=1 Tax=Wolbachia pipientis TaxID=955 RepID=UPI0025A4B16B|nr:ankyrin repeat domain-containing protein [Wolbachia pipientis]MDM8334927.1 ankyrin repeat domain-containing protein [Wolbachia pipientis]
MTIWKYASKYDKLIDDFYFLPIYSEQKYTPLHLLAESGDYEAVKILLIHIEERYTSRLSKVVNTEDGDGYTPLHLAAYSGKLGVVKCLTSKGADVNVKDKYGNTPLHMAVEGGKLAIIEHLIRNGADVNVETSMMRLHYVLLFGVENWK